METPRELVSWNVKNMHWMQGYAGLYSEGKGNCICGTYSIGHLQLKGHSADFKLRGQFTCQKDNYTAYENSLAAQAF